MTGWPALALALMVLSTGCDPMPCFGDSCSCYGDPEAPDANAGCSDCTPEASCQKLEARVIECGGSFQGSLAACEGRLRLAHTCLEGIDATPCSVLSVACPGNDAGCFAELVVSGATSCTNGLVSEHSSTIAACASGHCLRGVCVECSPHAGWGCASGLTCSIDNRCVPACAADADCGPGGRCFGGECDPPVGSPCTGPLDCGSRMCVAGSCTAMCSPACEPGSFCSCPQGFGCVDGYCAKAP